MIKLDEAGFILLTDKILEPEKTKIVEIADRLDEFNPDVSKMTHSKKLDTLKKATRDELKVDTSVIEVDLEININSDDYSPLPKEQDNLKAMRYFTYKGNNWLEGKLDGYTVYAKVYSEPSQYGIDNGRISKLHITNKDGKEVVSYDRGWWYNFGLTLTPTVKYEEVYEKAINLLDKQRVEMTVENVIENKKNRNNHER